MFAGLQKLNKTVLDTRPFTDAMGVAAGIQQDAQEYVLIRSSLFDF